MIRSAVAARGASAAKAADATAGRPGDTGAGGEWGAERDRAVAAVNKSVARLKVQEVCRSRRWSRAPTSSRGMPSFFRTRSLGARTTGELRRGWSQRPCRGSTLLIMS